MTDPNGLQDISDVKAGASALVHRCLLQGMREGYRLHDLVLEYLQLIIAMDDGRLAKTASSRQARYLARLGVFKQYHDRGTEVSSSGLYTLVALWNSVKRLDGAVNVEVWYRKSLDGVTEIRIATQVAWLLSLLVRSFFGLLLSFHLPSDQCTQLLDSYHMAQTKQKY